jgi:urease accessory protein
MKATSLKLMVLCFLWPINALAHTGFSDPTGFMHGLMHPIGGLDHLLAMIAVGLWAVQLGGRALWLIPSVFVVTMMLGGLLGFNGLSLPLIEEGILLSILIIGLLITSAWSMSIVYSIVLVASFALCHGYAHGAEMPVALGAIAYTFGFTVATALLHGVGIGVGLLGRYTTPVLNRIAGGIITLSGVTLILLNTA